MDGFRCNGVGRDCVTVWSGARWCTIKSGEQDLRCWLRVVRKVDEPACVQATEDNFGCSVDSLLNGFGVPAACDVFADLVEQADGKIGRKILLCVNELADDQAATISMRCAADEVCRRKLGG